MNIRKRISTVFITVLLVLSCLSSSVFADVGPKPTLIVKITNPPAEDYFVALLYEGNTQDWGTGNGGFTEDDAGILNYILTYNKDGYSLFQSPVGANIFHSNGRDSFTFGYMVPDTFKVLVITSSGDEYVSNAVKRHSFHSEFYYDIETGVIRENRIHKYSLMKFGISTAVCMIVTLAVEALVLLFFSLARRKNWKYFFFINVITQIVLNALLTFSGFISMEYILMIWLISEILIIAGESAYYRKRLVNKNGERSPVRNVAYGITANLLSLLAEIPVLFIIIFIFGL